ncbi:MAG: PD-(D/E)XK nuclease family protein, partial [Planctomycetota bacterium]
MDNSLQKSGHRVFLGLDQPPLTVASQWLIDRFQSNVQGDGSVALDLSNFVVVLPSARARNRLLQLLVQFCREQTIRLVPPTITTLGHLPEYLYVAEKRLATELAQQIAWSKALQQSPIEEIRCLTGNLEMEDLQDWQPIANLIAQLHARLANDIWSFSSVAKRIRDIPGFLQMETDRWDALKAIQKRYYQILGDVGLWDKQAARNYAAAGLLKADPPEIRCRTDKHIVMLATADLNLSISEMLRQVATDSPELVSILIAADPEMADQFDDFGSLVTEKWLKPEFRIDNTQIRIVDQPADQADAAAHYITQLGSRFASDEVTIGIPDESIVPQIERSLNAIQLPHRNLAGRVLSDTSPVRLMIACKNFLQRQDFDSFAMLVRHPDMFQWIVSRVDDDGWLEDLDEFQNNYLPNLLSLHENLPFGDPDQVRNDSDHLDADEQRRAEKLALTIDLLNQIHGCFRQLLNPLLGDEQPIGTWAKAWSEVLVTVYEQREMDRENPLDRRVIAACEAIYSALGNQDQVPVEFDAVTTASQALDWAIEAASERRVVDPAVEEAVELAGWLDLTLDDAPVMVVTSMNDEFVPTSEFGHQFLPNELCKSLKILDNDRRYARDAYALKVITSVRENLLLIVGRRDEKGEPRKPSRLLFCGDHMQAAKRAKAFFTFQGKPDPRLWLTTQETFPDEQQFRVPKPPWVDTPKNISVTKFKSFIKCPYRFYLQHILKLRTSVDNWRELSGGTFGDLAHKVMEDFAKSPFADSTSADQILTYMNQRLKEFVDKQFFGSRLPAVKIQVAQMEQRLERFAPQQAQRRSEGWKIVSTEEHHFHKFMVDGQPFVINGKIDRIDRHESTGQVAVWDYKTSDSAELPGKAHYQPKAKKWLDLQLPLYRHLVKEDPAVQDADLSDIILGYILLPKDLEKVGFEQVDWNRETLETADDKAREIVRKFRKSEYWPPTEEPPKYSQDFAAI